MKIMKAKETIVMDTCMSAKYDGVGPNGSILGGKGSWPVIGLNLRDVTIFDCFPCNGNT